MNEQEMKALIRKCRNRIMDVERRIVRWSEMLEAANNATSADQAKNEKSSSDTPG